MLSNGAGECGAGRVPLSIDAEVQMYRSWNLNCVEVCVCKGCF